MSGSAHSDSTYRRFRIGGLTEDSALSALFASGVREAGSQDLPAIASLLAPMIYRRERASGLSHGEALDNVLLAGWEYGRTA